MIPSTVVRRAACEGGGGVFWAASILAGRGKCPLFRVESVLMERCDRTAKTVRCQRMMDTFHTGRFGVRSSSEGGLALSLDNEAGPRILLVAAILDHSGARS